MKTNQNGSNYIVSPGLQYALDGAIALGQPLLLTGEPGTGKTTFAEHAVRYLNGKFPGTYHPEVLKFNTKTTSAARDLFYSYDALTHFQAVNLRGGPQRDPAEFIELQALGKAIAMSYPEKPANAPVFWDKVPAGPLNTVVLIDEVDKAPRDFTNDILDEILHYRFQIKELDGYALEKNPRANIVVVMTSNSEKNLPDAFLRRCAFYHIEFPKREDRLLHEIVQLHLGTAVTEQTQEAYDALFDFFYDARDKAVQKKPATAELIAWLRLLGLYGYFEKSTEDQKQLLLHNLSFLVKTQDDLNAVRKKVLKM